MKLKDLLGNINLDDFIIIFDDTANDEDENNALYNGCVEEFWETMEEKELDELLEKFVTMITVRELKDTIGAGLEIIVRR